MRVMRSGTTHRFRGTLLLCLAACAPLGAAQGSIAPDARATRAAMELLQDAVTVQRNGRHNQLLRALRHLEDPRLRPLFERITHGGHPALRVHGILGKAEVSPEHQLTLAQIAALPPGDAQNELISAGLDGGLLSEADCLHLLGWAGLEPGVKLLLAARMIGAGLYSDTSPGYADLVSALGAEALGQRGLAALLLHQLGDERGTQGLIALNNDPSESRDAVRGMLLETAIEHELSGAGAWAYSMSTEFNLPARLGALALQTAMRFGDPRAVRLWGERFAEAEDLSSKTRLGLAGLEVSPWVEAEAYEAMIDSEDAFLRIAGQVAAKVASQPNDPELIEAIEKLLAMRNPLATAWVADYAQLDAQPPMDAKIAAAVIHGYERGMEVGRTRRLDSVMHAVETLASRDAELARRTLGPILRGSEDDGVLRQVVLLGLIRSKAEVAEQLADELPQAAPPRARSLAMLLRLRRDEPLSAGRISRLEALVRGETGIADALRIQAAWAYLKRSGQSQVAVTAIELDQP